MKGTDWRYDTAKDFGMSFIDRLKQAPREPDPVVYAARIAVAVWARSAMWLYNRFSITGREHLPRDGSFVMVANHASHFDAVALLSALPLRTLHHAYPIAARDYFCANDLRLVLTAIIANVMLFDRGKADSQGLELCQRMLQQSGNVLVMFPEGTRSTVRRVGRFKRGIGLLVAGTPYPVVPCYLDGTFSALPKGAVIPRPARVRLAIGEPRTYERVANDEAGVLSICADLRGSVLALASRTRPHRTRPMSQEVYP